MQDSIFTKIIKGELPSHKIYEDDLTIAFMDIHPIQEGHVVVVPKTQVSAVWDLDSTDYRALMDTVRKVAQKIQETYPSAARVGVIVEGLGVKDHAHVNVFPFNTTAEFRSTSDSTTEPNHTKLAEVAERLAF